MAMILDQSSSTSTTIFTESNMDSGWYNLSLVLNDGIKLSINLPKKSAGDIAENKLPKLIKDAINAGNFKLYDKLTERPALGGTKKIVMPASQQKWLNYNLELSNKVILTIGIHRDNIGDGVSDDQAKKIIQRNLKDGTFKVTEKKIAETPTF